MSLSALRNITPISRARYSPEVNAASAAADAPARDARTDRPRVTGTKTSRTPAPVALEPHWQATIDFATD